MGPVTQIRAAIDFVEPLLGEIIVTLKLPADLLVNALFVNVDETLFQPGAPLTVGIAAGPLCLFDPETEEAIVKE